MSSQYLLLPHTASGSLSSFARTILDYSKDVLFAASWDPLTALAERAVLRTLANLNAGELRIVKQDGTTLQFPVPSSATAASPCAELIVLRNTFWLRLASMGGLGFAEAYMFGDVYCTPNDLRAIFRIFLINRDEMDAIENPLSRALAAVSNYLTTRNALGAARGKISAHYDISNRMFEGFLSRDMMYSSGLFETLDVDLARPAQHFSRSDSDESLSGLKAHSLSSASSSSGSDSENETAPAEDELHEAQLRKIQHILRRLKIRPGDRVLEIGTGWGEFAIRAVQSVPCYIDSITLSSEQKALAEERIAAAGLQDRIRVHLLDYRALPAEWEGAFDRFVSIEMIEHVGCEFLATYFGVVHWALKSQNAVGVFQVSTMPESRIEAYKGGHDFIQKWIFPGAFLPSVTQLLNGIHEGSKSGFIVDTIDNMGPHYPQTLREWARRFERCFEDVIAPELIKQHGVMSAEDLEIFHRKWIYYFYYCEAGFTSRTLGNHTVTFTREAMESYGCNIQPPS